MENENRKEVRQASDGTATVRILEGPYPELEGTNFDALVIDVSASGLCLDCDELLDQCTLQIKVTLEGSTEAVTLRGEVRWATWEEGGRYQMGVEFAGNDSPVIIKWRNVLKSVEG